MTDDTTINSKSSDIKQNIKPEREASSEVSRPLKDVTIQRLKALSNGWTPIRNVDKATYMKGWPDLEIDQDEIMSWDRMTRDAATGIRVENGLAVVDIDVDDPEIVRLIGEALMDLVPAMELEDTPWLERHSGKAKVAWFFRTDEPFGKLKTAVFVPPGCAVDDEDAETGFVEIFGGGSARQFGAFGSHSHDERGNTLRSYGWRDRSPLDTRLDELPVITKAQFVELSHKAAEILKAAGWLIQPLTKFSDHAGGRTFDLHDDHMFHCNDGVPRTLVELQAAAGGRDPLRCSMSWKEGAQAKNRTRGLVGLTKGGLVFVHDTQDAVTHLPVSAKPTTDAQDVAKQTTEEVVTALADKLKERQISPGRLKIKHDDDYDAALAKAVQLYALCTTARAQVVPVYPEATNGDGAMTLQNFRVLLSPHDKEEIGPKGGVKKISVVDAWSKDRLTGRVAGVRVAPGKERPLFTENGETYINRYRPPVHAAGVAPPDKLIAFIARLVPDPTEREWLLDRLGHKLAHPDVPGPATVFVSHKVFGTGRGTFFQLLRALLNGRYFRELSFSDFTGKTSQSQYNDWAGSALIACINESSDAETGSRYSNRRAVYEHVKEVVEPRPHEVSVKQKGEPNYVTVSATSFFIATNHADALPIPHDDRRIAVLMNGERLTEEEAGMFNEAVASPAEVAAFYHWLLKRGYGAFNPFAPPPLFKGKQRMADANVSAFDEAWADAMKDLREVFTSEALRRAVMAAAHANGAEMPPQVRELITNAMATDLFRVGERNGHNWHVKVEGRKLGVYCRTRADAEKWTEADSALLRAVVLAKPKNGREPPEGGGSVLSLDRLRRRRKDTEA
ncbi:DUF5906 domain-containing protein [Shinella sp.]|uniref:DUF5906 domain-containing protein n=1 Tax=Shinella sp. TaxID=1870904 RepID=UPI003F7177CC